MKRGAQLGHLVSNQTRLKISKANSGKIRSKKAKLKISLSLLGKFDEESRRWKGNKVSYTGLHKWVYKHLGKADKCENRNCVYPRKNNARRWVYFSKRFEWANISGKYLRDLRDWKKLCGSCHRKFDRLVIKKRKEFILNNF